MQQQRRPQLSQCFYINVIVLLQSNFHCLASLDGIEVMLLLYLLHLLEEKELPSGIIWASP